MTNSSTFFNNITLSISKRSGSPALTSEMKLGHPAPHISIFGQLKEALSDFSDDSRPTTPPPPPPAPSTFIRKSLWEVRPELQLTSTLENGGLTCQTCYLLLWVCLALSVCRSMYGKIPGYYPLGMTDCNNQTNNIAL